MLNLALIRHGKTYGNTLGRYVGGRTNEPLCKEGIALLKERVYPEVELVYRSPMKRCRETAEILYPQLPYVDQALFCECDFGVFENKNYHELAGNPEYQKWIDSNGTLPFPDGESQEAFQKRCCEGFLQCIAHAQKHHIQHAAMVVHGGTIMSICCAYASPKGEYFSWQIPNGGCLEVVLEEKLWEEGQRFLSVKKG